MSGDLHEKLRRTYIDADAAERLKRAELWAAVREAFQEPDTAVDNVSWALREWGNLRTADLLAQQPQRIGTPRGALLSRDGWTAGATERARRAQDLIGRLPDMVRDLAGAEARLRVACDAYEAYCREIGREPLQPWQSDRQSIGAQRVPDHLVPDENDPLALRQRAVRGRDYEAATLPDLTAPRRVPLDPDDWRAGRASQQTSERYQDVDEQALKQEQLRER